MPKSVHDMTAREALLAYGFRRDDDGFYRHARQGAPTQVWRFVDNKGWERFDPEAGAGLVVGAPVWGVKDDEAPEGYVKVPYQQTERFKDASGLHPATHPECFDWIWPEFVVKETYAYAAVSEEGNTFKKNPENGQFESA